MDTTHWGGPGEDYRLSVINAAAQTDTDDTVDAPQPDQAAPVWQPPKALRTFPWFETIMTAIGAGAFLVLVVTLLAPESSGISAIVRTSLLALLPLFIVLSVLIRIDRWEPEPPRTKLVAFLWGGGVATLSSSIFNTALMQNAALSIGDLERANMIAATFFAPLVEETLKGLGVLIIVVVRKNSINSILDGIVYAGYSAAGFMFAEDILYFIRSDNEGTGALIATVIMRGIFSPFVHVMATSMTGIGLGIALLRMKRAWSKVLIVLIFWVLAMGIHGLWNGSASYGGALGFLALYGLIQVPLFVVWLFLILRAARHEAEHIRSGLVPYVRTGWILPGEVTMVTDAQARKAALRWTKPAGRDAKRAMQGFLSGLAALGLDQYLMARTRPDPARIENDRQILAKASEQRQEFLRLTSIASQQRDVNARVNNRYTMGG